MNKTIIAFIIIALLTFTACGSEVANTNTGEDLKQSDMKETTEATVEAEDSFGQEEPETIEDLNEVVNDSKTEYKPGEAWVVDGQWSLPC